MCGSRCGQLLEPAPLLVVASHRKARVTTTRLNDSKVEYGQAPRPTEAALDQMVSELEGRADQQRKFSRRRTEVPGADVDFINDRNKHFNKKIKRAFDKYTVEIRQNLERGTAL